MRAQSGPALIDPTRAQRHSRKGPATRVGGRRPAGRPSGRSGDGIGASRGVRPRKIGRGCSGRIQPAPAYCWSSGTSAPIQDRRAPPRKRQRRVKVERDEHVRKHRSHPARGRPIRSSKADKAMSSRCIISVGPFQRECPRGLGSLLARRLGSSADYRRRRGRGRSRRRGSRMITASPCETVPRRCTRLAKAGADASALGAPARPARATRSRWPKIPFLRASRDGGGEPGGTGDGPPVLDERPGRLDLPERKKRSPSSCPPPDGDLGGSPLVRSAASRRVGTASRRASMAAC